MARYWIGGGTNANWNASPTTNWSDSSGGVTRVSPPTTTDDVIFDGAGAGGNSNSTISASANIRSLTITSGYTSTLTHSNTFFVQIALTLSNSCTINTTGFALVLGVQGGSPVTITSNGKTWPSYTQFCINNTYTLVGDFTIGGQIANSGSGNGIITINRTTTENLYCNGINLAGTLGHSIGGNAPIYIIGGTWIVGASGQFVQNPVILQGGSSTITISGIIYIRSTTVTYVSGTMSVGSSTLQIQFGSTMNTGGMTWNNVQLYSTSSASVTLGQDLNLSGTLSTSTFAQVINRSTSQVVNTAGIQTTTNLSGNALINWTGGIWIGAAGSLLNNLNLKGGVMSFSGTCNYSTGTITWTSGTTTGTGFLNITTCTMNTVGGILANVSTNGTITLTSNLLMAGLLSMATATVINRTITETWTTTGGLATTNGTLSGNAEIIIAGGTWSHPALWQISSNLTLNGAGNITISGTVVYGVGLLKYVSGTILQVSAPILNIRASCSVDTSGMIWTRTDWSTASSTTTLISNFNSNYYVVSGVTATVNASGGSVVNVAGNGLYINGLANGTATIVWAGGLWVHPSANPLRNNLTIQAGAGTVTVQGNVYYSVGVITYVSGNVVTINSTLNIDTNVAGLWTEGMSWYNIIFLTANTVCYIGSLLTVSNRITATTTTALTFSGLAGFTTAELVIPTTGGQTMTFQEGVTYTVTRLFENYLSAVGFRNFMVSSSVTNKANFVCAEGTGCKVAATFTRLNASGGRPIRSFNGVITDCDNIVPFNDLGTIASAA